jgi:C2H2 type zinc finger protein
MCLSSCAHGILILISMQFVLSQGALSPSLSDTTTTSFPDSPFAGDLDNFFSNFDSLVHIGEKDDTVNIPLDLSFAIGEGGESPSVMETSVPPLAKGIDQNATRKDEEAGQYIPASNTRARVLKRRSSVFANGSSPARLKTPVPDVEYAQSDDNRRRKFLAIAPAPTSASAPASTPTPTPVPVPAPAAPISTPASARPPRRPGNRRRGGGTTGRARKKERHPCRVCKKTFSRSQDLERHIRTSCTSSNQRATVVCPECHSVLSRMDAAQRHWRAHQNPTCPPPDWVSSRSLARLRL